MIAPLLGFAKQGSAEGKLLYVNYGRTEDFDVLKKNFSISSCSEYIIIMRFGKIYRGDKVRIQTERSPLVLKYDNCCFQQFIVSHKQRHQHYHYIQRVH